MRLGSALIDFPTSYLVDIDNEELSSLCGISVVDFKPFNLLPITVNREGMVIPCALCVRKFNGVAYCGRSGQLAECRARSRINGIFASCDGGEPA